MNDKPDLQIHILRGRNGEDGSLKQAGLAGVQLPDDGTLQNVCLGESDLLLRKLQAVLATEDARPLFLDNFLERLDESVDLKPIFEALKDSGRQVFIAVPHYYEIKTLEEIPMLSTPFDPRATKEFREMGFKIVTCPVCGKETLDDYFICPNCGWEYDGTTEENVYSSCNKATIADYRKKNA